MFISEAFKQDTLSKNTKIIPLVIIEKYISGGDPYVSGETGEEGTTAIIIDRFGFSTNNIELIESAPVGGVAEPRIYFKPLLMGLPKLKESIDVKTGKYKISSVTLNLNNYEYGTSRISDLFTNNLLLNEIVSIHLKSQSCTTITPSVRNVNTSLRQKDCATIYVGKIRRVTHTDEKVTIQLEDLTEQKIHKDLPSEYLGTTDNNPDKYKNKPIPMIYGHVENSPLVGETRDGRMTFIPDYKDIYSINDSYFYIEEQTWLNGGIKIYDEGYVNLLRMVQNVFVVNEFTDDDEEDLNDEYAYFDVDNVESFRQYSINNDNSISFQSGGLWSVDRIQGLKSGKPNVVNFLRTEAEIYENDNLEFIDNNDYQTITDNNNATNIIEDDEKPLFKVYPYAHYYNADVKSHYVLRWEIAPYGSKFHRLVNTSINNYKLPVRGDANLPSGLGLWDYNRPHLFIAPDSLSAGTGNNITLQNIRTYFQFFNGFSGTPEFLSHIPEQDIFGINQYPDVRSLFTMSANHGNDTYNLTNGWNNTDLLNHGNIGYTWNPDAPIKFKTYRVPTHTSPYIDIDGLPMLRFHEGKHSLLHAKAPLNFYCIDFLLVGYSDTTDVPSNTGEYFKFIIEANINEIDYTTIVEYDDAHSQDYYGDVTGRIDEDILSLSHADDFLFQRDYLENPIDILRHILTEELGITNFDEEEYEQAWQEHSGWMFAFSVKDKINSKKLIEDISNSTMSFPRLKNNGKFGFVTIEISYDENHYNNAVTINEIDILSYNYSLTSPEDVVSKLDLNYGYDYGAGDYLEVYKASDYPFTDMEIDENQPVLKFNGIENSEDNKVVFDSKYIQDFATAWKLKQRKYLNEKLAHLIIDLKLPLNYSEIEVGTLIKFPKDKVINGVKAYGMDYTNPIAHGGLVRLPLFLVTSVDRGLDSISISCYHLHWLAEPSYNYDNPYLAFEGDIFWNDTNFPNINWTDPMYNEVDTGNFEPYEPAPFIEFLIGNDSSFMHDETQFQSSYSREFIITDTTIGTEYLPNYPLSFSLRDNFENMFGLSRLGMSDWESLIPSINSDGSGYGSITNGYGNNNVGGFIGMEIRMTNGYGTPDKILSLRNIAGTEFDSDVYDPLTTIIPDNITPSTTELKLGWVFYHCDNNWNYTSIHGSGNYVIDDNLLQAIYPTTSGGDIIQDPNTFNYNMVLYPYYSPVQNMTLTYSTALESSLLISSDPSDALGDFNLDGSVSVLDLVGMVSYIMGNIGANEQQLLNADINDDEIVDILDVIQLTNIINENQ